MDKWIKSQIEKYANKNFGEPDIVIEKNLKVWQKLLEYTKDGCKDKTFLDLGANNGRISWEMKQKGMNVLAVDLEEVLSKSPYDIPKVYMDLEQEFPDGEWDYVWCRETIEHLRNYEEVLTKILRAMHNQSLLFLTVPHSDDDGPKKCHEHVRVFKDGAMEKLLKNKGFKVLGKEKEKVCRSTYYICCL